MDPDPTMRRMLRLEGDTPATLTSGFALVHLRYETGLAWHLDPDALTPPALDRAAVAVARTLPGAVCAWSGATELVAVASLDRDGVSLDRRRTLVDARYVAERLLRHDEPWASASVDLRLLGVPDSAVASQFLGWRQYHLRRSVAETLHANVLRPHSDLGDRPALADILRGLQEAGVKLTPYRAALRGRISYPVRHGWVTQIAPTPSHSIVADTMYETRAALAEG